MSTAQSISQFVRATALLGYRDYVLERGVDADALLSKYNIDPLRIGEEDYRIAYADFILLLEDTAQALDDPLFGLHFSLRQDMDFLGAIAAVARSAPTLLHGVHEVARYIHHFSPAAYVGVESADGLVSVVLDINLPTYVDRRQIMDLKLGLTLNAIRSMAHKRLNPVRVEFRRPALGAPKDYSSFFDAPVSFAQPQNSISFRREDLTVAMDSADQYLHDLAAERVSQEVAALGPLLVEQVKALISRLLSTPHCNLAVVAEKLFLHERTLQRQLKEQGTSFQALVDEVRQARASAFLDMQHLPLSQVAGMLGFNEQSSFNKACKRWWGQSPGNYRKQLRG